MKKNILHVFLFFLLVKCPCSLAQETLGLTLQSENEAITLFDYCNFLNIVAPSDFTSLYDEKMATDLGSFSVLRSGAPGSYHYAIYRVVEGNVVRVSDDVHSQPACTVAWQQQAAQQTDSELISQNFPITFVSYENACFYGRSKKNAPFAVSANCNIEIDPLLKANRLNFQAIDLRNASNANQDDRSQSKNRSCEEDLVQLVMGMNMFFMVPGKNITEHTHDNSERAAKPAAREEVTLQHFRRALDDYPDAKRFVFAEDKNNNVFIEPRESIGSCPKDKAENITIMALLGDLLLEEHGGSEEIVDSIMRGNNSSFEMESLHPLSAEKLRNILRRSDIEKSSLDALLGASSFQEKEKRSLFLKDTFNEDLSLLFKEMEEPLPKEVMEICLMLKIVKENENNLHLLHPQIASLMSAESFIETVPLWNEVLQRAGEIKGDWVQIAKACQKISNLNPEDLGKQWMLEATEYRVARWDHELSDFKAHKAQCIAMAAMPAKREEGINLDPIASLLWNEVVTAWTQAIEACQRVYDLAPAKFKDEWGNEIKAKKFLKHVALSISLDSKSKPEEPKQPQAFVTPPSFKSEQTEQLFNTRALEQKIEYNFTNKQLLTEALTHSSYPMSEENNERLEFLGDSVIQLIITKQLFDHCPDLREGKLTTLRAHLVKGATLHHCAKRVELDKHLRAGSAEKNNIKNESCSILGDAFEALAAAIYLDGGLDAAQRFVLKATEEPFKNPVMELEEANPKGRLQEIFQAKGLGLPIYDLIERAEHNGVMIFRSSVSYQGELIGVGTGCNKKESEKAAAREALKRFE